MDTQNITAALECLVDDYSFQKLARQLDEFNIFEAVGLTHQEIRHSTFLAFLLSPRASHTLGDRVLKEFLALAGVERPWLDSADLTATNVSREQDRIDVLAVNPINNFVLLIENKIYTGEHSDQLARYYEIIESDYPGSRIIAVYLTRDGSPASHPAFVSMSYAQVCNSIENVINTRGAHLRPIVRETIEHYIRAVRKNIVADDEIKELCLKIYREHKSAIDAIIRNVPARESQIYQRLLQLIEETPGVTANFIADEQFVGFVPDSWDELQRNGFLHTIRNDSFVKTGRPMFFQVCIQPSEVEIVVQVRYGTTDEQNRLFNIVAANTPPMFKFPGVQGNKYTNIYRQVVFTTEQMQNEAPDILIKNLETWWAAFIAGDFTTITKIFVESLNTPIAAAPIRQKQILARVRELISETPGIAGNKVQDKRWPGFVPESWDNLANQDLLTTDMRDPWMQTGRLLFFQFGFQGDIWLQIDLQLRYGTREQRKRVLDIVARNRDLMEEGPAYNIHKEFGAMNSLYVRTVLSGDQLANPNIDSLMAELELWWKNFLATDFKAIEKIFLDELIS